MIPSDPAALPHCPPLPIDDWAAHRPAVVEAVQQHVYGWLPPAGATRAEPLAEPATILDGRGVCRQWRVTAELPGGAEHAWNLVLFTPAGAPAPVPTFLAINRVASHLLIAEPCLLEAHLPDLRDEDKPFLDAGRGSRSGFFPVERILSRGFGLATTSGYEIEPDVPGTRHGIRAQWPGEGDPASRWGALAAWAWGLGRMVDVLVGVEDVDAGRLIATGHSRRGKAALLAAAMDTRIAMAIPHQSGTGGMALSRLAPAESVRRITTSFPHWFCPGFADYAGRETDLPLDQHYLAALLAPRPLLDTEGFCDDWASPHLAQRTCRLIQPLYAALGAPGRVTQIVLDTPHTLSPAWWDVFCDHAGRLLG